MIGSSFGAQAVVLTRRPDSFERKAPHLARHHAVSLHAGDVRSFTFPEGEFSHIIHAATETSTDLNGQDPLLMIDTVVAGTRRVLDFAVHCHAEKFLLTSSGAIYGAQPPEMTHIPEDYSGAPDTMNPNSAYGEGKRMAELLCSIYADKHAIQTKIARCFAFVGPHLPLDAHFAIGNFIRDALAGGPIEVGGDGTPRRSYLYAADLAVWLWTILFRGQSCRPYNVGSDDNLSIADLAHSVACHTQPKPHVTIAHKPDPCKPAMRYVPSIDRGREELGLCPFTLINEGIRRTVMASS